MANITISNNSITVTDNTVTINYTTDVTLNKVELTNDGTNWITASSYDQTSAIFDISNWANGTYSNCKLRITYEVVDTYGNVVLNTTTISLNEGASSTFEVKLDSAPTDNQLVTLSVNNNNCSINKTSLTFTPSNYSTYQSVTVTGTHDSNSYVDKSSTITATSNANTKTLNVTIVNIDEKPVDTYTITNNLSNCSTSNSSTSINKGSSYSATITANSNYTISNITVTMGGTNITSSAVSGNTITISSVTGNIVITASATAVSSGGGGTTNLLSPLAQWTKSSGITAVNATGDYSATITSSAWWESISTTLTGLTTGDSVTLSCSDISNSIRVDLTDSGDTSEGALVTGVQSTTVTIGNHVPYKVTIWMSGGNSGTISDISLIKNN